MKCPIALFLLALGASAACSAPAASSIPGGASSPPPVPSSDTLCKLTLGLSTVDDAVRLLGTPFFRQDEPDGTTALAFQFSTNASTLGLAELDLRFSVDHRLASAVVSNIPPPACWAPLDAGP